MPCLDGAVCAACGRNAFCFAWLSLAVPPGRDRGEPALKTLLMINSEMHIQIKIRGEAYYCVGQEPVRYFRFLSL